MCAVALQIMNRSANRGGQLYEARDVTENCEDKPDGEENMDGTSASVNNRGATAFDDLSRWVPKLSPTFAKKVRFIRVRVCGLGGRCRLFVDDVQWAMEEHYKPLEDRYGVVKTRRHDAKVVWTRLQARNTL